MDEETGKLTGMLAEYIPMPKIVWGIKRWNLNICEYDDYNEMLQALQNHEIDMIFFMLAEILILQKKKAITYKYTGPTV